MFTDYNNSLHSLISSKKYYPFSSTLTLPTLDNSPIEPQANTSQKTKFGSPTQFVNAPTKSINNLPLHPDDDHHQVLQSKPAPGRPLFFSATCVCVPFEVRPPPGTSTLPNFVDQQKQINNSPVLSAQLMTAPTGRPSDILNLAPADPPRP